MIAAYRLISVDSMTAPIFLTFSLYGSVKCIARSKRYQAGFAFELEDKSQLPAAVAEESWRGDGWIKFIGN